jgi:hypothetical protein
MLSSQVACGDFLGWFAEMKGGDVVYDLQAREDPPMIREGSLPLDISCSAVLDIVATRPRLP